MDFAVRIKGETTGERDAKVELDERLIVVEVECQVLCGILQRHQITTLPIYYLVN
jgi:hypothetical protein